MMILRTVLLFLVTALAEIISVNLQRDPVRLVQRNSPARDLHLAAESAGFSPAELTSLGTETGGTTQTSNPRPARPHGRRRWCWDRSGAESPIIHVINETQPITYAYRVRYVGRNLKFGPLGDPVVCTVSV